MHWRIYINKDEIKHIFELLNTDNAELGLQILYNCDLYRSFYLYPLNLNYHKNSVFTVHVIHFIEAIQHIYSKKI